MFCWLKIIRATFAWPENVSVSRNRPSTCISRVMVWKRWPSCVEKGDKVHAPRPNLILLDLNLPKMDGRQVLAEIKNDVGLKSIPTIILTSSELMTDIDYCYKNSANCYLRKPTDWDAFNVLVGVVNRFWLVEVRLHG
jgi:CheY-like chemotaxis protein